ncbi:MAG: hypothetical protein Q4B60_01850 [Erysipelotrichaceae bacterium]|nr:hypothetical protein [Erysipelotrichaceae bacterium]
MTHNVADGETKNWIGYPRANGKCAVYYDAAVGVVYNWNGNRYTDSLEVQQAKTNSQNISFEVLNKTKAAIATYDSGAAIKAKLDSMVNPYYTFNVNGQTVRVYYKKSSSGIETMETEKSSDGLYWANFTVNENGEVEMFNYVDKYYSYSRYDDANESEWIGSAVIK